MEQVEQTTVSTQPINGVQQTTTKRVVTPAVATEHPQKAYATKKSIFRTYQVIWYLLSLIEVLLAFRVALKALGANPLSGFVSLIYIVTDPLALPFHGVIANSVSGTSVFEWTTIIAAVVYFIIAWGITYIFQFINPVTPDKVVESVDNP